MEMSNFGNSVNYEMRSSEFSKKKKYRKQEEEEFI